MIQEIKFGSYTATPGDYECPDGDLALAANLGLDDGDIKPIAQPRVLFAVGEGKRVFLHSVGRGINYIAYDLAGENVEWIGTKSSGKSENAVSIASGLGPITSVAAVGYILVIATESGMRYIRYDANLGGYVDLGGGLPDIEVEFALKLHLALSDINDKYVTLTSDSTDTTTSDDDWQLALTTAYDLSSSNGDVTTDNLSYAPASFYNSASTSYWIASKRINFNSDFSISKGVDYKLQWDLTGGVHSNINLVIWGYKNGDTSAGLQVITILELNLKYSKTWTQNFSDDWTGIAYQIIFRSLDGTSSQGSISWYQGIDNSDTGTEDVESYIEYTEQTHTHLMAQINKYVQEQATDKKRFIYPFFVRYGVQLYDGSYIKVSAPILMLPNTGYVPAINYSKNTTLGTRLVLSGFVGDLLCRVTTAIDAKWRDLIMGVDIFVSQPIWPYDQGKEYDGQTNNLQFKASLDSFLYGCPYNGDVPCDRADYYAKYSLSTYVAKYLTGLSKNYVQIAPRDAADIMEDVETTSAYYKISSLDIDDLISPGADFTEVKIENGALSTLVNHEALEDDVLQYQGYKAAYLKEYNHRLHLCHSSAILPLPFTSEMCFNYLSSVTSTSVRVYVFLKTEDGQKLVVRDDANPRIGGPWYFYPDNRAYKAAFVFGSGSDLVNVAEVTLKQHTMLNGSYWLGDALTSTLSSLLQAKGADPYADSALDNSVSALSTIYVSEANSPFAFKAATAVSVGAVEVFAISCAAKALSQGQFGQFPLYAFSTEGVWALEPNSVGSYSARQPIARDVCSNIASITQLDSSVAFASARGIMLLSGSTVRCISDTLKSLVLFDPASLPGIDKLAQAWGIDLSATVPSVKFTEFLQGCSMVYYYAMQRLLVYNPDYGYCYCYSIKDGAWGVPMSNLLAGVNSYPEAMAIDRDGNLVTFVEAIEADGEADAGAVSGLLVTRPLKLGLPNQLKTVHELIVRGDFGPGAVQSVLYGSRDLRHWFLVASSADHALRRMHGSPYKYFRLALRCQLGDGDSLWGCTVSFEPRLGNRLR